MDADLRARLLRLDGNALRRPVEGSGTDAVLEVVRRTAGIQAQGWRAATLAVRARSAGTHVADVEAVRTDARCVVHGWYMRGTLQLVPSDDADWLVDALGPPMIKASARRYRQLGLDEDACERGVAAIGDSLAREGPLTRGEIAERLLSAGLRIDPAGQETYHLIRRAALEGRVCHGPHRDGHETWVATGDWLSALASPPPPDPVAELARRYLRVFGLATSEDFASWSGLSRSVARTAFARLDGVAEVTVAGAAAAVLDDTPEPNPPDGQLRLLQEEAADIGRFLGEETSAAVATGG